MNKSFLAALALPIVFAAATPASAATILSEGFTDIAALAPAGWVLTNESTAGGIQNWFQGNEGIFAAQSGAASSYLASNYLVVGVGGQVSNWLITPIFSTATAGSVTFWINSVADAGYQDQFSYGFSSGSAITSAFTMSSAADTPHDWTQVTVAFAAGGVGSTARFAIAHVGPEATSNYIGVDTLSIDVAAAAVPETATWMMMIAGFGLAGSALRRSRKLAVTSVKASFA